MRVVSGDPEIICIDSGSQAYSPALARIHKMTKEIMSKKYCKNQGPTILEVIVVGVFKMLWFLVSLPFKKRGKKRGMAAHERAEIVSKRQKIEELLSGENEYELRHAVMEADKLVDHVLKLKGYNGETFAERLRSAEQYIDHNTYQNIWAGHKTRNTLAHEHDAKISKEELRQAIDKLLRYLK